MRKLLIYNHGKDSMPWGEKALALTAIGKRHGYQVVSPDYRAGNDPDRRVEQLLATDWPAYEQIVLIGSSMGAYVATVAAETIKPRALFLIAPAFYLPGYQRTDFNPCSGRIVVFHGWRDDVVPPENAWRFCQCHRARLHMLDGDHRLLSALPEMVTEFERLLLELET